MEQITFEEKPDDEDNLVVNGLWRSLSLPKSAISPRVNSLMVAVKPTEILIVGGLDRVGKLCNDAIIFNPVKEKVVSSINRTFLT